MRVFVTGVNGQLGHDCMAELSKRGYEAIGSDIQENCNTGGESRYVQLDITDREAVQKTISGIRPDVIIHCAAWTAVDAAEDEENRPKVHAINAEGTRNIAEAARAVDAKMI